MTNAHLLGKMQEIRGCFAPHRSRQPVESVVAKCGVSVAMATAPDEGSSSRGNQEGARLTTRSSGVQFNPNLMIRKAKQAKKGLVVFF